MSLLTGLRSAILPRTTELEDFIAEHGRLPALRHVPDEEIRNGKCSWVTEFTHEQIRTLTMELVVQPHVAVSKDALRRRATVASRARAKGWSSLAAWDDLDDPSCAPTGESRA